MIRTFVKPNAAIVLVATLLCIIQYAIAQAPAAFNPQKMETVLYSVAYYPECMAYERLDQEVQLMQQAGHHRGPNGRIELGTVGDGQETYWKGVLGHDLGPGRIGPRIVDYKRTKQVAILYGNDSYYGIEFMKFSDRVNDHTILRQMYRVLYRDNLGVDLVVPETHESR